MKKVVINASYGGFWLSERACLWLCKRIGLETPVKAYFWANEHRDNKSLVWLVENKYNLPFDVDGEFSNLVITYADETRRWYVSDVDDGVEDVLYYRS